MHKCSYMDVAAQDVDMAGAENVKIRWLIDKEAGAEHFWMRHFEVAPGGCTPRHAHEFEHEVFVLTGKGTIDHGGQDHELSPGDVIFLPADDEHQFKCTGDEPLTFLCLVPAD